jgi:hypothetical protein
MIVRLLLIAFMLSLFESVRTNVVFHRIVVGTLALLVLCYSPLCSGFRAPRHRTTQCLEERRHRPAVEGQKLNVLNFMMGRRTRSQQSGRPELEPVASP